MPTIQKDGIQRILDKIDNLPTPPVVYSRINEMILNPNSSAYHIASIISEDPALSAKILRLSNSAFYGTRAEISSVKQAIITIGLEAIKSLVLSTSVFKAFSRQPLLAEFQEEFWRHSLAVGSACRLMIRKFSQRWIQDADKAFSAGLLHDIGKLVIIAYLPEEWDKLENALMKESQLGFKTEKAVLGYTHADIGAALATRWNLPQSFRDAIAYHHNPLDSALKDSLAPLVHCSNSLAHYAFDNEKMGEMYMELTDQDTLDNLRLKREEFGDMRAGLIGEYANSEIFLEISRGL